MSRERDNNRHTPKSSNHSWSKSHRSKPSSEHRHHHHDHHHQQSSSTYSQQNHPPFAPQPALLAPPPFFQPCLNPLHPLNQSMIPVPQQAFASPPIHPLPPYGTGNFINPNQQVGNPGFQLPATNPQAQDTPLSAEIMNSLAMSGLDRLQLPAHQITKTGIIPNIAYYELPAGLMVPLVPLSRNSFQPIDPSELRLPLPKFPDENFLKTLDSYYQSDSRLRDSDGWDQNFLATYRAQKETAISSAT